MLQEVHIGRDSRSGWGKASPWFAECLLAPSYLMWLSVYESFIMIYLITPPPTESIFHINFYA